MKYTESHEWVTLDPQGVVTVGITEYAQKELGKVVYIELPKIGKFVRGQEDICVLESQKAAIDVHAPLSGRVVAVNTEIMKKIDIINEGPEHQGWLFQIEADNIEEYEELLDSVEYENFIS